VLAVAGCIAAGAPALAATFGAAPASLTVERPRTGTQVVVSSLDARRAIFDVSVLRGDQGDEPAAAADVVVVPPVFAVEPYGAVVVRLAFRSPPPAQEVRYRLVATEVLSAAAQQAGRVPRTIVVPLTRR
jgi:P pilus assembly chaperone PapD